MKETDLECQEESALLDYIWRNYAHKFLTDHEQNVFVVASVIEKTAGVSPKVAGLFHKKAGYPNLDSPEVTRELEGGLEAFRRRVLDRIMREHRDEMEINRCPSWLRIVRTPLARQCLWCGFDWHSKQ